MRDSFDRIAGLGIAFPDSYSWTTCGFSLIACASAAWVIPLASLAVMMRFLSSEGTLELEWVMMLSFDFGLREREGEKKRGEERAGSKKKKKLKKKNSTHRSWASSSVSLSSLAASFSGPAPDLLVPAVNFFTVSTAAPERRAALTALELVASLVVGRFLLRMIGFQSWPCILVLVWVFFFKLLLLLFWCFLLVVFCLCVEGGFDTG